MRTTTLILIPLLLSACGSTRALLQRNDSDAYFAFSVNHVDPDTDVVPIDSALGIDLEVGRYVRTTALGPLALEGHLGYSRHDLQSVYQDPIFGAILVEEEPVNFKLALGVRQDLGEFRADMQPYVRAGFLYQYLVDDLVDDAGFGIHIGAGVDFTLAPGWALGPSLWYSTANIDDIDVDELAFGLRLSHGLGGN